MTLALRLLKLADRGKYIPRVKPKESKDPQDWITVGEDLVGPDANENTKRVWYKVFSKSDREELKGIYDSWEDLPGFPDTLEYVMGAGDSWYLYAAYQGKTRGYTVNDYMYEDSLPFSSWPPNLDDVNFEKRNKQTGEVEETYETRKQDHVADMEMYFKRWVTTLQEKCHKELGRPKDQIGSIGVGKLEGEHNGPFMIYMTTRSDTAAPFRNVNQTKKYNEFHKDHKHTYLRLSFEELQDQFNQRIARLRKLIDQENRLYWEPSHPSPENTPGPQWKLVQAELVRENDGANSHWLSEPGYRMDVRVDLDFPRNENLSFSAMRARVKAYAGRIQRFRRELELTLLQPWEGDPRHTGLKPAIARHKAFLAFASELFKPFEVNRGTLYTPQMELLTGRDVASVKLMFPIRNDAVASDPKHVDDEYHNVTSSEFRRRRKHNESLNEMLQHRRERILPKMKAQAERRLARIQPVVMKRTPKGFRWKFDLSVDDDHRLTHPTVDLRMILRVDESVTTEQLHALISRKGNPLTLLQLQTQAETVARYLARTPGLTAPKRPMTQSEGEAPTE